MILINLAVTALTWYEYGWEDLKPKAEKEMKTPAKSTAGLSPPTSSRSPRQGDGDYDPIFAPSSLG